MSIKGVMAVLAVGALVWGLYKIAPFLVFVIAMAVDGGH